jgi:hypothetical protein
MRNMLIAAIAGVTVCFAGDFTAQAEAQSWRRGYRQFNRSYRQFDRRWNRSYRVPSYRYNRGYYRGYYAPRRYYYTPRYHYGYRNYGWNRGWNRGGVWFRF